MLSKSPCFVGACGVEYMRLIDPDGAARLASRTFGKGGCREDGYGAMVSYHFKHLLHLLQLSNVEPTRIALS